MPEDMAGIRFHILGPLEVIRDGVTVDLPAGRPRALLALLLLHANEVVVTARMLEELWRGDPPPSAPHALQVHVLKLRKILEADRAPGRSSLIVTRPGGYALVAGPEQIDAGRFEALVDEAAQALDELGPAAVSAMLGEALSLWRGPVVADLRDEPYVAAEAARLEELQSVATERWVEAELALGRHTELIGQLERLVREHPFRERLWAQLMIALYRAGRPADALDAYQRLRKSLAEELGLEPSPELRRLETAVLRHDPDLALSPSDDPAQFSGTEPAALLPMPDRLLVEHPVPFVGRAAEQEMLEIAWKKAAAGRGRVTFVAGEPGIGKTRLATELATHARNQGGLVLFGTCDEELAVPYQPFVDALRQAVHVCPETEVLRAVGERGTQLSRLVPEVRRFGSDTGGGPSSDPETERYLLFNSVVDFLAGVAEWRPVLLFLDDLHWATKPTLLLLRHLIRAAPPGLFIVAVYRSSDVADRHPLLELLAELHRESGFGRLNLEGLSGDEGVAMIQTMAGRALNGEELDVAQAVHAETGGSPFFIRELVRHFVEAGGPTGAGSLTAGFAEAGLPESVIEVIRHRLSRLPEPTARLLAWAAVVGQHFDAAILTVLTGLTNWAVLESLDVARRNILIREVKGSAGRYSFVHALIRDAFYDDLGSAQRAELHAQVAEAFESLPDADAHLTHLARHWVAATRTVTAAGERFIKAAAYADLAGRQAMQQLAYEEAINHFAGALAAAQQSGHERHACTLLISLGEAQCCAGDARHRKTLLQAGTVATQLGDVEQIARAALANRRGFYSRIGATDVERVAALVAALNAVGPGDSSVRALLLAALATEVHFEGERRLDLAREAVAMAQRVGDDTALAQTLAELWFATWGSAVDAQRGPIAAQLEVVANRLTDRRLQFQADLCLFLTATGLGDLDAADRSLAGCRRLATELGQPVLQWRVASLATQRAIIAGDLGEAERLARKSFELGEAAGQPDRLPFLVTPLVIIRLMQGRPEEVPEIVAPVLRDSPGVIGYPALLAWALADDGDEAGARAIIERLQPDHFAGVPHDYIWLLSMCSLSRACSRLQDSAMAGDLYSQLLPNHSSVSMTQSGWIGPVTHDLALLASVLGNFADADLHFRHAVTFQDRIGARAAVTHTRIEWARMLLQRGAPRDTDDAHTLLQEAHTAALALDLPAIATRAASLEPRP